MVFTRFYNGVLLRVQRGRLRIRRQYRPISRPLFSTTKMGQGYFCPWTGEFLVVRVPPILH